MLWIDGVLALNPARSIVCPGVWASRVQPFAERWGGTFIALHEGESLEMKMSEADALLGTDHDGRVAFRDRWYGFADGLYAAARLLEVLVTCGRRDLAELLREIESPVSGVADQARESLLGTDISLQSLTRNDR
jgi:phosphomannomutase / phosphoglucomutase